MFGYTMMYAENQTWKMYQCYKNYYCGVCFGLMQNYGHFSRLFLSHDIALIALILNCHEKPLQERLKCFGQCEKKKCLFGKEKWKQIAAMNMLLINEKIKDNIHDDNSKLSLFLNFILKRKISKAEQEYSEMAKIISAGYEKMFQYEINNSSIRNIEDAFAEMMIGSLSKCKELDEWEKKYIRLVARWIYYIDALDDYSEDYKKNKYNALQKSDAVNLSQYIKKYYKEIISDLNYIFMDLRDLKNKPKEETIERKVLLNLVSQDIFVTTSKILGNNTKKKIRIGSIWEQKRNSFFWRLKNIIMKSRIRFSN